MARRKQQRDERAQDQAGQGATARPPAAQEELTPQRAAEAPPAVELPEPRAGRAEPMQFALGEDGALCNAARDASEAQARLKATTGLDQPLLAMHTFRRIATMMGNGVDALNLASQALHGLEPQSPLEAMLTAEMVAVHELGMRFAAEATMPGQTWEGRDVNVRRSTRCMAIFLKQTEALLKLRGKGSRQVVVVQRVDVAPGAQAIVGAVEAPGGA